MNAFSETIVTELKKHHICKMYWSNEVESQLGQPLELKYEPTEYIGYYKSELQFNLAYLGDDPKLKNSNAQMTLIFTSTQEIFNLERAMSSESVLGAVHAVNAIIKVKIENDTVFSTKFTLWSNESDKVEGFNDSLKLFI